MIKLKRAIRIKEQAELPSGTIIQVDINVEDSLPEILKAYTNALSASERARANPKECREEFYEAYSELIALIMGKDNWALMLDEFDNHTNEVCEAIAPWINETVTAAIADASNRRMNRRKRNK